MQRGPDVAELRSATEYISVLRGTADHAERLSQALELRQRCRSDDVSYMSRGPCPATDAPLNAAPATSIRPGAQAPRPVRRVGPTELRPQATPAPARPCPGRSGCRSR